jgi:hypothetical protein
VFAGLAVTGALSDTQRNHGVYLFIAFAFVLFGAVLWFTAALIPAKTTKAWAIIQIPGPTTSTLKLATVRWVLQLLGVVAFAAGIGVGLSALIQTQGESQRPSVSASFNEAKSVLSGTASADGLGSSQAVTVRVQGMSERIEGDKITLVADRRDLYYALVGPDSDGKVSQKFNVSVPKHYNLVGVKAWSGDGDRGCQIYEKRANQTRSAYRVSDEDGCLVMRIRTPEARVAYRNCTALHKRYTHGVGRVDARDHTTGMPVTNFRRSNRLYRQNKRLDRDKDGIACEKR